MSIDIRLVTLALGMFALGTDNFVVAGILPSVAHSLNTSPSLAGQMVTVYALSYALMSPVMAAVAGGWPRKRLLVGALGLFVLGNAITALAADLPSVLLGRAVAGLGAALFAPTALGVASAIAPPERRGRALSTVTAGLAGATALGAPLGTFIAGFGSWRTTLWFVAALGLVAMAGAGRRLSALPQPPRIGLRERVAPVGDPRIALTLLTSLFAFGGFLAVYAYAGLVLRRVTAGDERVLAGLLLLWGVAATAGNLLSGRLVDRLGSQRLLRAGLGLGLLDFALLPWTSAHPAGAAIALAVWGVCGWGLLVPQQHRLVKTAPQVAPLLLALHNTATYAGLAGSGALGGFALLFMDARFLPLGGAALIAIALLFAEAAHRRIEGPRARGGRVTAGRIGMSAD